IDQAWQGSVVLGLVFESNGQVRDVQIVRSSGIDGLDKIAREGAMKWRLDAASIQPSDLTVGRRHMIKFYQKANVKTVVAPARAFWREL
ncbi:MAG: TonB family protein, partial [Chthoniobacterales bacterium]